MRVQVRPDVVGISHAMNARVETQTVHRLNEEATQFLIALAVTPIPDPDQVRVLDRPLLHAEQRRVRGLMPSKNATAPTAREIDLPKHFSERQHRVVAFKIEVLDLVRLGQRPMVRVMKEQQETSPPNAMTAEACHQAGLSPFMHKHDVCISEGFVEIERTHLIRFDRDSRHKLRAAYDRGLAMIPQ